MVFELSPESGSWKFSVTYIFNGFDGSLGSQPSGGLALDSSGNLYGTTGNGGDLACNNGNGCGTIFELSPRSGGGFTFSKLRPYSDWENVLAEAQRLWTHYTTVAPIEFAHRLAVRYINNFSIPAGRGIQEYITDPPVVP